MLRTGAVRVFQANETDSVAQVVSGCDWFDPGDTYLTRRAKSGASGKGFLIEFRLLAGDLQVQLSVPVAGEQTTLILSNWSLPAAFKRLKT